MSETYEEQLGRVRMMSEGSDTWDLSDNDIAALKAVFAKIAELERQLAEAKEDTARLDWLQDRLMVSHYSIGDQIGLPQGWVSLREAIDAARKETE